MGFPSVLLVVVSLLSATVLSAQVKQDNDRPSPHIFARLSYNQSGSGPPSLPHQFRNVCLAVTPDGDYRAILTVNNGEIQRLQGKMAMEQFDRLRTLLSSPDFRALSGDHGGLLREYAESFRAEVVHPDATLPFRTQRIEWLNADGENPFPGSVLKVIRWLKDFKPTNAQKFVYSEFPDVCPSADIRLLHPSVASSHAP